MKDLEKIKSEDLAAQVQDANPANFAIEQEVAQLVGATVPAPTEPSADDARELGAQLLVFLRRALTPIQTALRTAVAAIYAHLDSRCTDYTPAAYDPFRLPAGPYDPMRPFVPRTLPNLLTALTAFSARKISNGSAPNDGIPDGISLAHLLCSTNTATKIVDDNYGWIADKASALQRIMTIFDSCRDFTLNFVQATAVLVSEFYYTDRTYTFRFPYLATLGDQRIIGQNYVEREPTYIVYAPSVKTTNQTSNTFTSFYARQIYLENYEKGVYRVGGSASYSNPHTTYIYCGCKGKPTDTIRFWHYYEQTQLTDFEIRQGARQPIELSNLTGLTAENIVNHIFEKLADNSDGDPITINIGSTNLAKLTDEQKAIAQNKNYTLA